MAKMIPPSISASTLSDGEIEVFNALKTAPEAADWVVLHSLDIAKHISQVSGEADFVIFVPGLGALCLEVKACRSLRRDEGAWFYGSKPEPDYRGPFKQAENAKHSILEFIRKQIGPKSKVPFFSAVAFTHVSFQDKPIEWHAWQVIDKAKIDRDSIALSIINALKSGRKHLENTGAGAWLKREKNQPEAGEINKLITILRPEFEYFESPASRKKRAFEEIKKYTEEQFAALDFAEVNDRIAYNGPAGTGKTFLAIEIARREAEAGNRVLLLCYNEMLGNQIKQDVKPLGDCVQCGTVSSFMLKTARISPKNSNDFWDHELPQAAKVATLEKEDFYDTVVVDEAQDFMSLDFIDFLDSTVKGGLAKGKVMLFGDFDAQAVQKSEITLKELKEGWIYDLVLFPLDKNCRNTPRVACLGSGFTNGVVKYKSYLRRDDGIEPEIFTYKEHEEQTGLLLQTISAYKTDGISLEETAVLSCKVNGNAVQILIDMFSTKPMANISDGRFDNGLVCTTVRRFKGLERFGIIITDVDNAEQKNLPELLYIASTRATGRLTLLVHEEVINDLTIEMYSDAA